MKKDSDIVQTVVLVVFGIGIIIGILFFSGKIKLPGDSKKVTGPTGSVVVWGVLPYGQVNSVFNGLQQKYDGLKLSYVEKKPETMQAELVDALSSGKGPDVFMMAPGQVAENVNRLYMVPFTAYSEGNFRATFADIGADFLTKQGILAFPVFIDPMVMYWNRDIFSSSFLVEPPKTWDELAQKVPIITQKDDAGKINQTLVALGTANNISYPKDLIVMKMLQSGNSLVQFLDTKWIPVISENDVLVNTLSWYTNFTNPSDMTYSWNQSLPKDREYFTAGKLGIYFGYPTEYESIRQKNPNLNFAMAMVPQISSTARKTDYGRVYSIGVSKITKNLNGAIGVVSLITSKETLPLLLTGTSEAYYAPARKDLLADKPRDDANKSLIYNSAIISKSFFDPDAPETNRLFVNSINQINSGTKTVSGALQSISAGFRDLTAKVKLPDVSPIP